MQAGTLQVTLTYQGAPPSTTGAVCNFNHNLEGFGFLGNLCDSQTTPNIRAGQYTLHLGYAFGAADLVSPVAVTIVGGQTTTVNLDVSGTVGVVTGRVSINGQNPPSGSGVCASSNGQACQSVTPTDPSFKLMLPGGAASGFVWGNGCQCIQLGQLPSFTVLANGVTDLGLIVVQQGSLTVNLTYQGAPPSTTGAVCNFNHNLEGFGFLGNLCDSQTTSNIRAGQYTLHLGYAFGASDLLPPIPVTITGGQVTTVNLDVSNVVGLVTGKVSINGQNPPSGSGVCASSNGQACQSVTPTDPSFKLMLPGGAASGFVWGNGCQCIQLGQLPSFTVIAGAVTNLGLTSVSQGNLKVNLTYQGAPPSTTNAACNFNHNLEGFGFLGNLCDSQTTSNIRAGQYTLHLGYAFGASDLLPPVPVTIVGGQTTTVNFDVSNIVGVIKGSATINGQPPPSTGYGVCGSTNGQACQGFPVGNGSFRLLLPAGPGTGFVWGNGCQCIMLGTFDFGVVAGQETDIGNPFDTVPPVTAAALSPAANVALWNNTNVTATLQATDNTGGSGVKEVHLTLGGAQTGSSVVVGAAAFANITTEGITTLTYWSLDNAGNAESPKTLTIRIDKTPPLIAPAARSPLPNSNGWNNTNVTFNWTCTDGLSGIQSNTISQTVSTEGINQSGAGTCTDLAGNTSSNTQTGINIDKTPPGIAFTGRTPPNANGWNNTNVVLNWSCTDALSGVLLASVGQTISTEGANQSASGTCSDKAGNTATNTQSGVNIDKTPPVLMVPSSVMVNATSPSGAIASYSSSAVDNLDPTPLLVCGPASGSALPIGTTTVSCNATDRAGNSVSRSFPVIVRGALDQTNDLSSLLASFNLGPAGNGLSTKLASVQAKLAMGKTNAACNDLNAFLNEVSAQTGKALTFAQANQLMAAANQIRATLGC